MENHQEGCQAVPLVVPGPGAAATPGARHPGQTAHYHSDRPRRPQHRQAEECQARLRLRLRRCLCLFTVAAAIDLLPVRALMCLYWRMSLSLHPGYGIPHLRHGLHPSIELATELHRLFQVTLQPSNQSDMFGEMEDRATVSLLPRKGSSSHCTLLAKKCVAICVALKAEAHTANRENPIYP